MSSSDYVNYSIRPNKTVERKLIFEVLAALNPMCNFENYRYVGLGSMWFVDFVIAHKALAISDLISIERDEYGASRADFNKPFACVTVKCGESQVVLPEIDLEAKPLIVWLDYDTSLDGPVLTDLSVLCQRAPAESIVLATINAQKNSLPRLDENGDEFPSDEVRLRYFAGDLIPAELPKGAMQASNYPAFLASLLFDHMRRAIRKAGRQNNLLLPLFNLRYKDNAQMITVGGAIARRPRVARMRSVMQAKGLHRFLDVASQMEIGVPPLTFKEKANLDQLMPCVQVPTPEAVSALGFRLKPSQIAAYHEFYRYYPTFSEIAI